ncbi:E3 ubiquitin-protein ligase RNF19B-like isoform X2 [Hemiscyllium ocellatum]|uniref:E3 ubiquitin-protein ligase RNF19B-like isoform X2 n=1 Tax=Hemiscyllium ocellatum TaxID=170820 RepID=UPI002966CEF7|nr:E3 ubiquitin-protein ligase RNF19B-like isoform X2 [Hemiscyllium ocellatum]
MEKPTGTIYYKRKPDESVCRAEQLQCGHYADVGKLRMLVKWLLDKGHSSFVCTLCPGGGIPWQRLRLVLDLPEDELRECERVLQRNTQRASLLSKCPACSRLVQRLSMTELMVTCPLCPCSGGKDWRFCWDCLREWAGSPGDRCGNADCSSLLLLRSCSVIQRPRSAVHQCPSVRPCPGCQRLLSHTGGCNNMVCPNCGCLFCYRCLRVSPWHSPSCRIQPNPSVL